MHAIALLPRLLDVIEHEILPKTLAGVAVGNKVFGAAIVNVCPGYAGLSITQSYWFGVPTIIGRDELHSPEIEAAIDGENTVFFESDSVADLGRTLETVVGERESRGRIVPDVGPVEPGPRHKRVSDVNRPGGHD